ncbi:hypothetical protein V6N11_074764 [Hibiscus sabdariffa]|uniref:Uncharacterized protein n=1 Tax=Hibiscus sabdariffa TaxID=183260 RepID=A0ABR2R4H3_9ROSI
MSTLTTTGLAIKAKASRERKRETSHGVVEAMETRQATIPTKIKNVATTALMEEDEAVNNQKPNGGLPCFANFNSMDLEQTSELASSSPP